jgi:hypothetical protein
VRGTRTARILSVANGHLRELDAARGLLDRRDFQILEHHPAAAADLASRKKRQQHQVRPDLFGRPLRASARR